MTIISYRYSNDRIYTQPILNRPEDKANILLARADWRADGVVPTRAFDAVFPQWVEQMDESWKQLGMLENTKEEALRVGAPTETNSVLPRSLYPNSRYSTNLTYEKATDNFIGFSRLFINGTIAEHQVSCFDPSQRGKGYLNDSAVLGAKAWFLYSEGEVFTTYTPKGQTSYYVEDPNIEIAKSRLDRIEQVDYIETRVTKADYTAWMDLPDKQADRDANFTIERYIEA